MVLQSYASRVRKTAIVSLAGAIAAGLVTAKIVQNSKPGENLWLILPLLLLVAGLALAAMHPWWRALDDVQKQGHLTSWWWGSMAGAMVVLMSVVAIYGRDNDLAHGAAIMWLGQSLAFLLAFALWRIRGRSMDE